VTMSKQDYVLIAEVIRNASMDVSQRAALTLDMEAALRPLNPIWDSRRWHDACRQEPAKANPTPTKG